MSWQGQRIVGDSSRDVDYETTLYIAPTWRQQRSDVNQLRFRTGAGPSCELAVSARTSFFAGPDEPAADLLASQFPGQAPWLLGVGDRDAAAWRILHEHQLGDQRTRFEAIWETIVDRFPDGPTIWGRVAIRAVSLRGHGKCTTHYYRDGRLRPELGDAMATVRLQASVG